MTQGCYCICWETYTWEEADGLECPSWSLAPGPTCAPVSFCFLLVTLKNCAPRPSNLSCPLAAFAWFWRPFSGWHPPPPLPASVRPHGALHGAHPLPLKGTRVREATHDRRGGHTRERESLLSGKGALPGGDKGPPAGEWAWVRSGRRVGLHKHLPSCRVSGNHS